MDSQLLDYLWIIVASGLVFLMQAGFAMVESGLTRSKNSINVAIKNLTDLGVSVIFFWLFGFALMFGQSVNGLVGSSHFLVEIGFGSAGAWTAVFFLFQSMFCSTSATIVSGAVAERMKYSSYIVSTILLSALIYPVFGHWAWGSFFLNDAGSAGWLQGLGFVDFAGSTVVHSVGGWIALAALLILGPRTGRFEKGKPPAKIPGSNIPMVVLGVLLLWFGWFGFNGGSTLAMNESVAPIIVNTALAAAAGMVATLGVGWLLFRVPDVSLVLNGSLAGLVAVTANCHVITGPAALAIGAIGGIVMLGTTILLEKLKIDDAVGAIPVHLAAGIWGTLAVALFGDPELIGTGLDMLPQLGVQALGVAVAGAWSFGVAFLLLWIINKINKLRVDKDHEHKGLNIAEHGASTEIFDLFQVLETQAASGNLGLRAPVEPFTEVGQIASRYNQVLDRLEESTVAKDEFVHILNSVNDGLLLIDRHGIIAPYYSVAAEHIFELRELAGRTLQGILLPLVHDDVKEQMEDFLELLFDSKIDYASLVALNPVAKVETFFDTHQGTMLSKHLEFHFARVEEDGAVGRVMVVIRDQTEEVQLTREIESNKKKTETEFELFYRLLHVEPDMLREFIESASIDLQGINSIFQNDGPLPERINNIYRHVHTIKGDAELLGLELVSRNAHEFEDKIEALRRKQPLRHADFLSLALAYTGLQALLTKVRNLLNRLASFQSTFGKRNIAAQETLAAAMDQLAQNLGKKYGKKVRLDMTGFDPGLIPPAMRKPLKDVLVQCVRNSLFHGIETPELRQATGKPAEGSLSISSQMKDNTLVLRISDDGKGISLEGLRERVVSAGILTKERAQSLSPPELAKYLFYPNISTADTADTTAGRGMGMNLVHHTVTHLGGKIELRTKPSLFTEFLLRIPLSPVPALVSS